MDDTAILQMLTTLGDLEVRSNELSRKYTESYREFSEVFRQILLEKEELNCMGN